MFMCWCVCLWVLIILVHWDRNMSKYSLKDVDVCLILCLWQDAVGRPRVGQDWKHFLANFYSLFCFKALPICSLFSKTIFLCWSCPKTACFFIFLSFCSTFCVNLSFLSQLRSFVIFTQKFWLLFYRNSSSCGKFIEFKVRREEEWKRKLFSVFYPLFYTMFLWTFQCIFPRRLLENFSNSFLWIFFSSFFA